MKEQLLQHLNRIEGTVSMVYHNLITGERIAHNEDFSHVAASVIKIPVMVEAFRQFEAGTCSKDELIEVKDADRVPICGVLTLMHTGLQPSVMDLITLMISISDNMATNLLIDRLGLESIQGTIESLGLKHSLMARKLFETRPGYRDKSNRISAADMAQLLEALYNGTLVSQQASEAMLQVLETQQLKNKTAALLPLDHRMAHKTGEDEGISHDVGIIYAAQPFILCLCGNNLTDEPAFNRMAGDVAKLLFDHCGGVGLSF